MGEHFIPNNCTVETQQNITYTSSVSSHHAQKYMGLFFFRCAVAQGLSAWLKIEEFGLCYWAGHFIHCWNWFNPGRPFPAWLKKCWLRRNESDQIRFKKCSNFKLSKQCTFKPENQRRLTVKTCNDGQGVSASPGFIEKKGISVYFLSI